MKNQNKGFIVPIVLVVVALLAIGGGVYVYKNKKTETPKLPADSLNSPINEIPSTTTPTKESMLPDLIIESVSLNKPTQPKTAPKSPSGIMVPPENTFEFTLKVKNIGSSTFNQAFYIENTRSNEDLNIGHYSHSELVNEEKKSIGPNQSLEVKVTDSVNDDVSKVRFLFSTISRYQDNNSKIEEKSYSNNSYEVKIP